MKLAAVLDMNAAAPLHEAIGAVKGRALTLDASEVDRLGALCLQVMLAARTRWDADGLSFDVADASPAFTDGAALLGASSLLPTS